MPSFALEPHEIQALAQQLAQEVAKSITGLRPSKAPADPLTDPTNWVRISDLEQYIRIARSTLHAYVQEGKIRKSKLSGCAYYYLPDIGQLLADHSYKAESVEQILNQVKGERRAR